MWILAEILLSFLFVNKNQSKIKKNVKKMIEKNNLSTREATLNAYQDNSHSSLCDS